MLKIMLKIGVQWGKPKSFMVFEIITRNACFKSHPHEQSNTVAPQQYGLLRSVVTSWDQEKVVDQVLVGRI
jgi:hypothetical protein